MSKIKVGSRVFINNVAPESSPILGEVVAREVVAKDDKQCEVQYMVRPIGCNDFAEYKIYTKKDLVKFVSETEMPRTMVRTYEMPDSYKLTLVAVADRFKYRNEYYTPLKTGNWLNIGWCLCSPLDDFDEKFGQKVARRRAMKHPFCKMESPYSAEFDDATVEAIMNIKAEYVKNHMDRFVGKYASQSADSEVVVD